MVGLRCARLPTVVWLSFQGCSGCTESLLRAAAPGIEDLLFDVLSLDYQPLLQAAAGEAADNAREATLNNRHGELLVVVDGAIPTTLAGACSTSGGESSLDLLGRCLTGAVAVIAVGSCAALGGLPAARPNPTGALSVGALMDAGRLPRRPLVNLPGCPPSRR
jgi:hydrogenase small subunit